jgi:hypothetical protein
VSGDDPKCCLVRVDEVTPVSVQQGQTPGGRGVQLRLDFDVHGGIGWMGDSNPAYLQDIYLIDEQSRRYPLTSVSGPSAVDNPTATSISGFYRFGPLASDTHFVWLHYGTDRAHSRAVILGFYLGAAAPAPTATPRSQSVNSGGTDTGCCRVTLQQAEALPDGGVRLYLAFNVFATGGWKGDSRPENAATIYLVDDQNRRINLQRVIGPSANDDATAVTTGGWYVFGPLSPGARRAHLQYGDAAVDFTLGAAAPP